MPTTEDISGYHFRDAKTPHTHRYLMPCVLRGLSDAPFGSGKKRVFDLGCGNGSTAHFLEAQGYSVTGVDPSETGIQHAQDAYPDLDLHHGSGYDPLAEQFGRFPALISLEVIEHVYAPRKIAHTAFDLLEPGGVVLFSTPYHGYLKNLLIALTGSYDQHHNPLWDHGHIKFWSIDTLGTLLREAGFLAPTFERVGRIPPLAKSLVAIARKPQNATNA